MAKPHGIIFRRTEWHKEVKGQRGGINNAPLSFLLDLPRCSGCWCGKSGFPSGLTLPNSLSSLCTEARTLVWVRLSLDRSKREASWHSRTDAACFHRRSWKRRQEIYVSHARTNIVFNSPCKHLLTLKYSLDSLRSIARRPTIPAFQANGNSN